MEPSSDFGERAAARADDAWESVKPWLYMGAFVVACAMAWKFWVKEEVGEVICRRNMQAQLQAAAPAADVEVTKCSPWKWALRICMIRSLGSDGTYKTEAITTLTCRAEPGTAASVRPALKEMGWTEDQVLTAMADPKGPDAWRAQLLHQIGFTDDTLLEGMSDPFADDLARKGVATRSK